MKLKHYFVLQLLSLVVCVMALGGPLVQDADKGQELDPKEAVRIEKKYGLKLEHVRLHGEFVSSEIEAGVKCVKELRDKHVDKEIKSVWRVKEGGVDMIIVCTQHWAITIDRAQNGEWKLAKYGLKFDRE